MRKTGSINKKLKYRVTLKNENGEILSNLECCSYRDIVSHYPIFKHEDNVRNYFRYYSKVGFKTEKSRRKYSNFSIEKILENKNLL